MYSLRRTLAVRFSLTMLVALVLIALWAFLGAPTRHMLFLMFGTVVLGTVATAFGAGWLGRRALAPVEEIAAQARQIEGGAPGQRITVHGDIEEMASLVRVLNGMLNRLEHAFEAQRRIIADVGHELRTPVTVMRGEIEVALRDRRSIDHYQGTLRSVLEELDHLSSISEAMILLARVEARDLTPTRVPTDVAELAAAAVRRITTRAQGRSLSFNQTGDGDPIAPLDARMFAVVLHHLLDNAVRYTPAGSRIETAVHTHSEIVTLSVRDTGPGVPSSMLPQLFERLYRGDPARSRTAGAGLGLTVAQAIVHAHGGTIAGANLPEGGFQVTISLPR